MKHHITWGGATQAQQGMTFFLRITLVCWKCFQRVTALTPRICRDDAKRWPIFWVAITMTLRCWSQS
jgi:hypothetical protein